MSASTADRQAAGSPGGTDRALGAQDIFLLDEDAGSDLGGGLAD